MKKQGYIFTNSSSWLMLCALVVLLVGLSRISLVQADNLITVSDFNDGVVTPWETYVHTADDAEATFALKDKASGDKEYCASITKPGKERWNIQLRYRTLTIEKGQVYTVSFEARAEKEAQFFAKIGNQNAPYAEFWNNGGKTFALTAGQTLKVTQVFTMDKDTASVEELAFHMGKDTSPNTICFDNVKVETANVPVTEVPNLLTVSNFNDGVVAPWETYIHADAKAEATFALKDKGAGDKEYCANITQPGTEKWNIQLRYRTLTIEKGHVYTVSFEARSEKNALFNVKIGNQNSPFAEFWNNGGQPFTLTAGITLKVTQVFTMDKDTASVEELAFHLGKDTSPNTICFDNIKLQDAQFNPTPLPTATPFQKVRVNQVGYYPNAPKRASAVISATTPVAWQLKGSDGKVITSGQTTVFGNDAASGDFIHLADFSAYKTTGVSYTLVVGGDNSFPFDIANNVYSQLKLDAMNYFYHNRSGIAITMPYSVRPDLARPAGHLSDTVVGCNPEFTKGFTCTYTLDVSKGWYDAGDHGKYVVNGGISVWTLLNQYERSKFLGDAKFAYGDGTLNLPENKNGVPDILDEARWQMEFMLAMQVPTGHKYAGMAHHKIHDATWTGLGLAPHEDPRDRYLHQPSTAATLNLAATAAQCARVWQTIDSTFAAKCLSAAKTAWQAAKTTPALFPPIGDGNGGGEYGDDTLSDDFYWAAAELYITTGEAEYLTYSKASPHFLQIPSVLTGVDAGLNTSFTWGTTGGLGTASLVVVPNNLSAGDKATVRANVLQAADVYLELLSKEGYLVPFRPSAKGYPWGSNSFILNNLIVMGLAYDITGQAKYLNGMSEGMDYILGRNAMDKSYITGYGEKPLQNPHHRFWAYQANNNYPKAPAGAVSGGPNSEIQDPYAQGAGGLKGCVPAKCFVDHIDSWSTNEITINWNGPLAWVTAFIDEGFNSSPSPAAATYLPLIVKQ